MENEDLRINMTIEDMAEPIERILQTALSMELITPDSIKGMEKVLSCINDNGLDYFKDISTCFPKGAFLNVIMFVGFKGDDYHYMFSMYDEMKAPVMSFANVSIPTERKYAATKVNDLPVEGLEDEDVVFMFLSRRSGVERFGIGNIDSTQSCDMYDNKIKVFKAIERAVGTLIKTIPTET